MNDNMKNAVFPCDKQLYKDFVKVVKSQGKKIYFVFQEIMREYIKNNEVK